MTVWVLLPAFNEASNLPPLLENLARVLQAAGFPFQVVVVDDGSTDGTAIALAAYAGRLPLRVVSHERNLGLARAIETGIRVTTQDAAEGDVVVTMDADNTHSAMLIPQMLDAVRRGADLVIASRYVPGGQEEGVPPLRRVLSRAIGLLMRWRFPLRIRDYSSGYRAYRVSLLRAAVAHYGGALIESRGFTVMAELLVKLAPLRPVVVEVPLHLRYDLKRGASKMRLIDTIKGYLGLLLSRPWRGDAAGAPRT
ncbi:MAG: glycosyltransferase [bacterium]